MTWPPRLENPTRARVEHPSLSRANIGRKPLSVLVAQVGRGELTIPDYQRPLCWTDQEQAAFVGFILEGGPCPAFFIREAEGADNEMRDELVDGQQRLNAYSRWMRGEIPGVLPARRRSVWAAEYKGWKLIVAAPVHSFRCTRYEAISLYITLAQRGRPHSPAEIKHARRLMEMEPPF